MADQKSDVHVEFFTEAVQNKKKSKEAGRPIFEDREFVRIKFPGDKQRIHVAPATDKTIRDPSTNEWLTYIDRYPAHYEAFQKNQRFFGEGTPVDEAPFLTNSQKAELKGFNIHTIEALANMPETNLAKLGMGARGWMNQARAYIDKASGSAVETRLAAENAEMREQMAAMQRQMAELMSGRTAAAPALERAAESDFETWADEDLKAHIKSITGAAPRGNPSHETLVRMAEEAGAQAAA